MPDGEQHGVARGSASSRSRTRPKVDSSTRSSLATAKTTDPSMSPEFEYLHDKLRREASSRQEACQLYDHLQKDYDDLLVKFAQAENTIDHLRIGATLTLFSDSPTPNQSFVTTVSTEGRQAGSIFLPQPKQAVVSTSVDRSNMNSIGVGESHVTFSEEVDNTKENTGKMSDLPTDSLMNSQTMAEGNRMGLMFQIQSLQEDVDMLQTHLNEGGFSQPELLEIGELLEHLKDQHNNLASEVVSSGNRGYEASFMQTDNLEGQLYRISLKLEEIDDGLRERLRQLDPNMSETETPDELQSQDNDLKQLQDSDLRHIEDFSRPVEFMSDPRDDYQDGRSFDHNEDESLLHQENTTDPELQELMSKLHDLKDQSSKTTQELLSRATDIPPRSSYVDLSSTSTGHEQYTPSLESLGRSHSGSIPLPSHYFSGQPGANETFPGQDTSQYSGHQPNAAYSSIMSLPPNRSPEQPLAHSSPTSQANQQIPSHHENRYESHPLTTDRHQVSTSHDHERNNRPLYSPTNSNAASSGTSPVAVRRPHNRASLSSVVDSSRVSTPVFQPRYSGFLGHRQSIHENGEKLRPQTAETADSGFIGSEGYGSRLSHPVDNLLIQPRDSQHRKSRSGAYAPSGTDSEDNRHLETLAPKLPPKTYSRRKFSATRQPALSEDSDEYRRSEPSQERRRSSTSRKSTGVHNRSNTSPSLRDFPKLGNNSSTSYEILTLPSAHVDAQSRVSQPSMSQSRMSQSRIPEVSTRERISISGPRSDPVPRQKPGPSTNQGTQHEAMKSSRDSDNDRRRSYTQDAVELLRGELDTMRHQLLGEADMRNMQAQMYDELKQRHEDLHRELIRKNAEQQYIQMYDDLKKKYDDMARDLANRTEPAPSQDVQMHNDVRLRLDELARELAQIRTNNTPPAPPPEVQMFDDLKQKIDKLSEEMLKTRLNPQTDQLHDPRLNTSGVPASVNFMCPFCSSTGVHRHGNYYYPGFAGFSVPPSPSPANITVTHTYQNPPGPYIPGAYQPTGGFPFNSPQYNSPPTQAHQTSQPSFFAPNGPQSTPAPPGFQDQTQNVPVSPVRSGFVTGGPGVNTHSPNAVHHHTHTHPGVQSSPATQSSSPQTVKHIHHYYSNRKTAHPSNIAPSPQVRLAPPPQTRPPPPVRRKIHYEMQESDTDSDWSSGEDEHYYHAKRVRPSSSRPRRRNYSSIQDYTSDPYELDTYNLHLSLEDANKAAREMQKISKHMLSSIAADLVNASTR